jgi:hypothetical protein
MTFNRVRSKGAAFCAGILLSAIVFSIGLLLGVVSIQFQITLEQFQRLWILGFFAFIGLAIGGFLVFVGRRE